MAKERIPVQEAAPPVLPDVEPPDPVVDLFLHRHVMGSGYIDEDSPTPPPSAPILEEGEESFLHMRRPQVLPDVYGQSSNLTEQLRKNERYAQREILRREAAAKRYQDGVTQMSEIIKESLPDNEIWRMWNGAWLTAASGMAETANFIVGDEENATRWNRMGDALQRGFAMRAQDPDNVLNEWVATRTMPALSNVIEVMAFAQASIPYFAVRTYHQSYRDAIDRGMSHDDAVWFGMEQGAYEGLIAYAMGKITGLHGLEGMNQIGKQVVAETFAKAAWHFGKEFGVELIEEYLTQSLQSMSEARLQDPESDWSDIDWAQNAQEVLYATLVTMGASKVAMSTLQAALNKSRQTGEMMSDREIQKAIDEAFPSPRKRRMARMMARLVQDQFTMGIAQGQQHGAAVEIDRETRGRLANAVEANMDAGMSQEEAMAAAREEILGLGEKVAPSKGEKEMQNAQDQKQEAGTVLDEQGNPIELGAEGQDEAGTAGGYHPGARKAFGSQEESEARAAERERQVLRQLGKPTLYQVTPEISADRALAGPDASPETIETLDYILQGDTGAIDEAGSEMSTEAHKYAHLIPLPDSSGDTTASLALATKMSGITGAKIVQALKRNKDGKLELAKEELPAAGEDVILVTPVYAGNDDLDQVRALDAEIDPGIYRIHAFATDIEAPRAEPRPFDAMQEEFTAKEPKIQPGAKRVERPSTTAQGRVATLKPATPQLSPEQAAGLDIVGTETVGQEETDRRESPQAKADRMLEEMIGDDTNPPAWIERQIREALLEDGIPGNEAIAISVDARTKAEAVRDGQPIPKKANKKPRSSIGERAKKAAPKKVRRNRIPETMAGPDILNEIIDAGRIASKPRKYKGGEYDDKPTLGGIYNDIMTRQEGLRPDQMAAALESRGIGDGTSNTMWLMIRSSLESRKREKEDLAAEEEFQKRQEQELKSSQGEVDETALEAFEREQDEQADAGEVLDSASQEFDEPPFDIVMPGETPAQTAIVENLIRKHVGQWGTILSRGDGSIVIRAENGLTIHMVPRPAPAQTRGKERQPAGAFRGIFMDGTQIVAEVDIYPNQLRGTYGHEMLHVMAEAGLVSDEDIREIARESVRNGWHRPIMATYNELYSGKEDATRKRMIREELAADFIERISDGRIIEKGGEFFTKDQETGKEKPLAVKTTWWESIKSFFDTIASIFSASARNRQAARGRGKQGLRAARKAASIAKGKPLAKPVRIRVPPRDVSEIRAARKAENEGSPVANVALSAEQKPRREFTEQAFEDRGTTNDWREAGYMRPDGKLADFTGRWMGGIGPDEGGTRYEDHRDIGGAAAMQEAMNLGYIRIIPEVPGVMLYARPNEAQREKLRFLLSKMMMDRDVAGPWGATVEIYDGMGEWMEDDETYQESPRRLSFQVKSGSDLSQALDRIDRFYDGDQAMWSFIPADRDPAISNQMSLFGEEEIGPPPPAEQIEAVTPDTEAKSWKEDARKIMAGRSDGEQTLFDMGMADDAGQQTLFSEPDVPGKQSDLFTEAVKQERQIARSEEMQPINDPRIVQFLENNESIKMEAGESLSVIARDYVENRIPNFTFQEAKIETLADAAVAMSIIRSPFAERMAWMVTDANGNKIDQQLHSIGAISGTEVPYHDNDWKYIQDALDRAGEDATVWFAHNHPSGDVTYSAADNRIYRRMAKMAQRRGAKMAGLVLNGTKFAAFDGKNGQWHEVESPLMPAKTYQVAIPGVQVKSPETAAEAFARIQRSPDTIAIFYMNAQTRILAVQTIASADFTRKGVSRMMGVVGASSYILATDNHAVSEGILEETVKDGDRGLPEQVTDLLTIDPQGFVKSARRGNSIPTKLLVGSDSGGSTVSERMDQRVRERDVEEYSTASQDFARRNRHGPIWFNKASELTESPRMPKNGTGNQMIQFLLANGISKNEIEWTGLADLDPNEKYTREQIQAILDIDSGYGISIIDTKRTDQFYKFIHDFEEREKLINQAKQYGQSAKSVDFADIGQADMRSMGGMLLTDAPYVAFEVEPQEGFDPRQFQERLAQWIDYSIMGPVESARHYTPKELSDQTETDHLGEQWIHPDTGGRDLWRFTFWPGEEKARFKDYKIKGGEDYTELLIRVQDKPLSVRKGRQAFPKQYRGPHFYERNTIVHARYDFRNTSDGEPVIFLQEVQSDWHQTGRNAGYLEPIITQQYNKYLQMGLDELNDMTAREVDIANELRAKGVVARPEMGYENGRYFLDNNGTVSLVEMVGGWGYRINYPEGDKSRNFIVGDRDEAINEAAIYVRKQRGIAIRMIVKALDAKMKMAKVPDAPFKKSWAEIGIRRMLKEAVDSGVTYLVLTNGQAIGRVNGAADLSNEMKGIKNFYDNILPKKIAKIVKKMGGKVEKVRLPKPSGNAQYDEDAALDEAYRLLDIDEATGRKKFWLTILNEQGTPETYDDRVFDTFEAAQLYYHNQVAKVADTLLQKKMDRTVEYNAVEITPAIRKAVMDGQPIAYSMPPASASNHDARVSQDKEIGRRLGQVGKKTGRTVFALSNPFDRADILKLSGDPEAAERIAQAMVAEPAPEGVWAKLWDGIKQFWRESTRTYKNLDERERAALIEDLKQLDNEISAAPVWAVRQIMEWQKGLTEQEKVDFTLAIALPDLMRELEDADRGLYADNPGGVPFYGRGEEETRSIGEILAIVKADHAKRLRSMTPATRKAVENREDWHRDFTAELVKANLLERDVLKDDRYFHRMVLKYLDSKTIGSGLGATGVRSKKVPAQFQRVGGGDFSLNFLMAEMEYIASMQVQMSKVAALGRIDENHNIKKGLRDQATNINMANMDEWWRQEIALEQDPEVAAEMARLGWDHEFRKRIAMNSSWLAERLAKGEIEGTPFAGMEEAANEQWRQYLEDLEEYKMAREEGLEGMTRPSFQFDHQDWFPFLHYLASGEHGKVLVSKQITDETGRRSTTQEEQDPSLNALSIFKAIALKQQRIKEKVGRKYVTWQGLADGLEDHRRWQPKPGLLIVPGFSISDNAITQVLTAAGVVCDEDILAMMPEMVTIESGKIKRARMAVGLRPEWVLPADIADQLDAMETTFATEQAKTQFSKALQFATGVWKRVILFGPWRWLKYEFNNMSGDLDAALTHPGILLEVPRSARDLWGWINQTPGQAAKSSGLFSVLLGSAIGAATGGIPGAIFGAALAGTGGAVVGGAARAMMDDPQWHMDTGSGESESEWQRMERMGIIDSGQLMNEVAENGWNKAYDLLTGKKPFTWNPLKMAKRRIKGYAGSVRNFNAWREGVLRVAAARYFYKNLGSHLMVGKKARKGKRLYGASRKDAMDVLYAQLDDMEEREQGSDENRPDMSEVIELRERIAARLARELIGDYGAISETGRSLRRGLAPFWAWQEVNCPRYVRLFKNSISEGGNGGSRGIALGTGLAIKSGVAIFALTGMVYAFNAAMKAALDIPDEEDPNRQEGRGTWIIVGRHDDGTIRKIKFSGAVMDALGWLGGDDFMRHAQNINRANRRQEIGDGLAQVAADVGKAPLQRLGDSVTPLIKTPVELFSGRRFYPDLFRPRKIKDRMDHLFSTGGLSAPYRVWAKTASVEMIANGLIYEETPGASSYWRTRELVMDYTEGKTEDSRQRTFTITQAKSAWSRKDEERARHWLKSYWSTPGVTWSGFQTSLRNSHPLNYIRKDDRPAFLASLDEEDRRLVTLATKWYEETAVGSPGFLALAEDEARKAGIEIPKPKKSKKK